MKRREALQLMGIVGGGMIIGFNNFLSGCKSPTNTNLNFSPDIIALLDEVGETIIPTTDTPGAKATHIGEFMKTIVTDCYTKEEQTIFMDGITELNKTSENQFQKPFIKLSPTERLSLLNKLNTELNINKENKKNTKKYYFGMLKELTLWGYFTSEIGQTQAMRYVPVPGRYDPCIEYKKGEKLFC